VSDEDNLVDATEDLLGLHDHRLAAVVEVLFAANVSKVLDLGCGEGKLIRELLAEPQFATIHGVELSHAILAVAEERLSRQRGRVKLFQGSIAREDRRFLGFDAAAAVEVIEHLDPPTLAGFERVIFGFARPKLVVVTTPNADYNCLWPRLTAGRYRHPDHQFEWTRAEFESWADRICKQHGYTVTYQAIGPSHEQFGSPSQMAIFELK